MFVKFLPAVSICLAAVLVLAAGCHSRQEGTQNAKYYGNDGFKGLTNANPNLPTSPTYHTYERDVKLMADALKEVRGIEDTRVLIQGADAYIALKLSSSLDKGERQLVENEAFLQLSRMMPRYRIHVTSDPRKAPPLLRPFWGNGK